MKIGLVCPYSLTVPGGVQGQVLGLARSLRNLGHEARVLAPCDGPPPDAGITPLGRSIPWSTNGSVAPLAPDVSCARRTLRALRDEAFDVAHLHEPLVPGPTLTALLARRSPLVGTFHRAGRQPLYDYLKPLTRWMAARLDARAAVSDEARTLAHEALGGEFEMLFNGVELDYYAKAEPWPTEGPTIVFMSRHESRKGLAVLLASLASLPSDVRVWVASDGPETEGLKAQYGNDERIEWLGRISEQEKARRLRGADVFCAPSLHGESFGVILIEAMAAAAPVVASDLAGYRLVARPASSRNSDPESLLVPPGDTDALAHALSSVLEDPVLAARLSAAGETRAATFSMDRLAERYLELYEQVAT